MAFKRNKKASNPNHGKIMSVENTKFPIQKKNEEILKLLDELENINKKRWYKRN